MKRLKVPNDWVLNVICNQSEVLTAGATAGKMISTIINTHTHTNRWQHGAPDWQPGGGEWQAGCSGGGGGVLSLSCQSIFQWRLAPLTEHLSRGKKIRESPCSFCQCVQCFSVTCGWSQICLSFRAGAKSAVVYLVMLSMWLFLCLALSFFSSVSMHSAFLFILIAMCGTNNLPLIL